MYQFLICLKDIVVDFIAIVTVVGMKISVDILDVYVIKTFAFHVRFL